MTKRVTLSDVAAKAGVSRAAASATLSGKAGKRSIRVSDEKKAEILKIAKTLGYVPNTAAQYLKSGDNNHIIAVFSYEKISPFDQNSEYYPFFAGIQAEGESEGYDILILNSWAKDRSRSTRIRLSSGAIMIGVTRDDEHITSLLKQNFPLVFVGRRNIGAGIPVSYVTFSYEISVRRIIDLLDSKNFIYLRSSFDNAEPGEDKSLFLHRYAKEKNMIVLDVFISDVLTDEAKEMILKYKCVICDRLYMTDLVTEFLSSLSLSLGLDVRGAVLEDDWMGGHEMWTRWENRRRELGSLAVKCLALMHSGEKLEKNLVDIPVIEAESTSSFLK